MTKLLIIALGLSLIVAHVSCTLRCYDVDCPQYTTGCKKHMKTTSDRTMLEKTISCLDEDNGVLKDYFSQESNPYGPYTKIESTSYSNTHTYVSSKYSPNDANEINSINHLPNLNNLNEGLLETFNYQ